MTAFQEGYQAISFSDNPYTPGTQDWEDWQAGCGSAWSDEISADFTDWEIEQTIPR